MTTAALASIRQRLAAGARQRRWRVAAAVIVGLALLWTLLGGWALPRLAKPRLEAAASEALGAPLAIERLEFAPWSLRARVIGLRLGPPEAPWLRVAEAVVDVSSESLWRLAPVLERVEVSAPTLELERQQPGRFNVSPMLDALARRPSAPPDAPPARFALYNLRLADGRVHVVDRVAHTEHTLERLSLGVPFVSNLPSQIAIDVEPHLDAVVDGSRFSLQGKTLPFQQGLRSSLALDVRGIDVHAWADALAGQFPQQLGALPVEVGGGTLDLALHIDFERRAAAQAPSLRITGGATLSGFAARVEQPALGVAIEQLTLEGLDARPLDRELHIGTLRVQGPKLDADLARLLAPQPSPGARPAQPPAAGIVESPAFVASIAAIEIDGGAVRLAHAAWPQPRRVAIESLRIDGLDTRREAPAAAFVLHAADDRGAKLQADGRFAMAERRVTARMRLDDLEPAAWLLPWSERLPVRLDAGRLGVQAGVDASPAAWAVSEAAAHAEGVELRSTRAPRAAPHAFKRIDLKLKRISSDLAEPIAFDLGAEAGRSGRIALVGELVPQPLALTSRIDIAAFDLAGLQPYLEPFVNVVLQSAKLDAKGELKLDGNDKSPLASLRWKGAAALADLRARDKLNDADLLRFKRLSLEGSEVLWRASASPEALAPLQADLGRVALDGFYGRVIVGADGRINLRDIVKHADDADRSPTTPGAAASAPARAASAAEAAAGGPGARLRWQGVRLTRGEVDFSDHFIRPNYSARLTELGGEVAALAWNDAQPAALKFAARVDGAAPVEITGSIHPLGARLAADVTATARGIDITRLTAYSARYAGYGIERGTLTLRVHYRIENGRLEADNQLVLDQLTFGEHVESPNAMKLPVQLAVALLKDRNGVIDVNLPVSGSLDDPQFSIAGVLARVMVNLVTRAVTAPFSLLARAFGGGGEELGHVVFAPGSSELDDTATKRLDALAKALLDRPALKLEATGHADRAADEAALRERHVERAMRLAKAKSLGELPDGVTVAPEERARWLEAAYRDAELKTKPRNVIGLAKRLPPEEMQALLAASATIDDAALRALADERGNRVKAALVARVAPERVLLDASRLGREGIKDDGPTPRVEFALR